MRIKSYSLDPDCPRITLTTHQCQLITNKLTRHFKLPPCKVIVKGRSTAYYQPYDKPGYYVWLPKSRHDLHTLVHELSHHFDYHKNGHDRGNKWHTKKQRKLMEGLLKYCEKKNYWGYND